MKITIEIDDKDEYGFEIYLNAGKMYDMIGMLWAESAKPDDFFHQDYLATLAMDFDIIDICHDALEKHLKKEQDK